MVIGIDLRVFQIGHQYRGIGSHIKHLVNEISKLDNQPCLVFYEYPDLDSGIDTLADSLPQLKSYEVRKTKPSTQGKSFTKREVNSLYERYIARDAGITDVGGIDKFLFIDFNLGVPKKYKIPKCLITYDLIPWVLSEHYLPGFRLQFKRTKSLKRALKAELEKRLYFNKIKQSNRRADLVITISEHTRKDVISILGIDAERVKTVLLGTDDVNKDIKCNNAIECKDLKSLTQFTRLDKTKYIFFMGGSDWRRRIVDLIDAFNEASKTINDLRLILVGYDFVSYDGITDPQTKQAVAASSYSDNILFAGFISDKQRNSLYKHAVAFIFPSVYEGFGLPLLEAMSLDCPSITYRNSSIPEVGGDAVLYANDSKGISRNILLINDDSKKRSGLIKKGHNQLKKFDWGKTTRETLHLISEL